MEFNDMQKLRVEDVMSTALIVANVDESITDADFDMRLANIRHIPVVDEKYRLAGIVSDRDVLRTLGKSKKRLVQVREVMTTNVCTIEDSAPASDAVRQLLEHKFGCLPVTGDQGQLVGMVTETDFLRIAHKVLQGSDL